MRPARAVDGTRTDSLITCSTGKVTQEEIKRAKYLQIITRNGELLVRRSIEQLADLSTYRRRS